MNSQQPDAKNHALAPSAPSWNTIRTESRGWLGILHLNRPSRLNTLTPELVQELRSALDWLIQNGSKVVVITGSERSFCAGADLSVVQGFNDAEDFMPWMDIIQTTYTHVEAVGAVTIAAIDGFCLGGGLELALRCDFRIATPKASFGLPEIRHGLLPTGGGLTTLVGIVGATAARDLVLTGRTVKADEALRMNLISHVVDGPLLDSVVNWADQFKGHSRLALRTAKHALRLSRTGTPPGWSEAVKSLTAAVLIGGRDSRKGVAAFLSKTPVEFE